MIEHDLHVFWYLAVVLRVNLQLGALLIAVAALVLALGGSVARRRAAHRARTGARILAFPAHCTDERRAA